MEITHFPDCVQIRWPNRFQNVYPGDPIPDEITDEVREQVEAWLKDCAIELKAQAMDDDAEREVFDAAVAAIEADEEEKRVQAAMEAMRRLGIK